MSDPIEQDLKSYNTLLDLWQAENPIKTIKLQFLLATNGGLVGFFSMDGSDMLLLSIAGVVLNSIWTLSIGRTSLFQKAWKNKLDEITLRHPHDTRFQILDIKNAGASAPGWLRILGGVSSKYYLLGAPVGLSIGWLIISLHLLQSTLAD